MPKNDSLLIEPTMVKSNHHKKSPFHFKRRIAAGIGLMLLGPTLVAAAVLLSIYAAPLVLGSLPLAPYLILAYLGVSAGSAFYAYSRKKKLGESPSLLQRVVNSSLVEIAVLILPIITLLSITGSGITMIRNALSARNNGEVEKHYEYKGSKPSDKTTTQTPLDAYEKNPFSTPLIPSAPSSLASNEKKSSFSLFSLFSRNKSASTASVGETHQPRPY